MCPITVAPGRGTGTSCFVLTLCIPTAPSIHGGKTYYFHCTCAPFLPPLQYCQGTIWFQFWGNMDYITEKKFYFRCYQICMIKGIWLRLRTRTLPVVPSLLPPFSDLVLASGPMNLLLPEFKSDQSHPAITAWKSHLALCISLLSAKEEGQQH